jgi:hypothetical protein
LLPVGLAAVVTTIANGLLSADIKARLVFLRWHHALPGNRAFSKYAQQDPRIDQVKLAQLVDMKSMSTPEVENAAWYRLYDDHESLRLFVERFKDYDGPIFVLDPSPATIERLEDRLRSRHVISVPYNWNICPR